MNDFFFFFDVYLLRKGKKGKEEDCWGLCGHIFVIFF